jgi:hypothetical protein
MLESTRRGFSIRIFLHDGTPEGLRIVEKSNWTGRALVCPRSGFSGAKTRPELFKTGVYVLLGPRFEGNLPRIYIGEGDPVKPRLESHFANKDFWTTLILFTSKDENMNKAHVQYLEARLAKLAAEAKRSVLDNGNSPQLPSLSEADTAEMEGFLEEMLLIYPVLGVTAFDKPQAEPMGAHRLYLKSKGIVASGFEAEQGFVVLANSQAVSMPVPSIHQYMKDLREALEHLLRYCEKEKLPRLTSICVSEKTGQPSHGYTDRVRGTPEELHRDREAVYAHKWYRERPVSVEDLKAVATG